MGLPLVYGLYLVAAATARAAAKYAIRKLGGKATGNLISRHTTKSLATKAKDVLSASKDTGTPMKFRNLPRSARNEYKDISGKPYKSGKKDPGATYGGGTQRSAVIGQQRVKDYTLKRRGEGFVAGAATVAAIGGGAKLIDEITDAKKEDAPTDSLKKQFINAVKDNTQDKEVIKKAGKSYDSFMKGETSSLSLPTNHKKDKGGYVKKYANGGGVRKVRT